MEILISVIIPVYNVEKYLRRCVDSVLGQTYHNMEIILIDDGSTDCSGKICDQYLKEDERIAVYHKKNEGLGLSRNFGIRHSHGAYLMFVDSDDYIESHMVKDLLKTCLKNQADLCIAGFCRVSDDGRVLARERYKDEIFEGAQIKSELLPRMICELPWKKDGIYTMVWGKLYSADSIKNNSVLFQSERKVQAEDLAFYLEYLPYVRRAAVIGGCYYYYRKNSSSLTLKYKKNRFQKTTEFYCYVLSRIRLLKLSDETLTRANGMLLLYVLACFRQELPEYSFHTYRQCYQRIRTYVGNPTLQHALSHYPIKNLNFKQKIYCEILKHQQTLLLIAALESLKLKENIEISLKERFL